MVSVNGALYRLGLTGLGLGFSPMVFIHDFYFVSQIAARAARPAVYAHVHILADHVTVSIG